jgi:hypothetical protein
MIFIFILAIVYYLSEMSEKKEWLKTEIDELIDLYHNKPVLWDVYQCKYNKNVF